MFTIQFLHSKLELGGGPVPPRFVHKIERWEDSGVEAEVIQT